MKRNVIVGLSALVGCGLILYFAGVGPWAAPRKIVLLEKTAEAQVHQHGGEAPAKTGPPEKPAAPEKTPSPQEAQAEVPTVEISPEKQQLIGVKVATVSAEPLQKLVRTVGLVEYDQTRLHTINTKVEGWIEKLYVNFTGTYVKKGEPVADIYSPELWATQQEFINVLKWAKRTEERKKEGELGSRNSDRETEGKKAGEEKAAQAQSGPPGSRDFGAMIAKDSQAMVEAARQRLKLWDISDAQIKKIEESEKPIRTLTVYSPVSGYVLQKNAVQGMKVMGGEKLFDVADLSTVWITADIYEFELPLIKVGDPATVQLSYFPGREFRTKIEYIYPTLQGETRTARARFSIPNEGGRLKPQMFTNIAMKINLGRKLAIPEDAVIDTGIRKVVYVDKGNGVFEPREVLTGVRAEKLIEVTAGLKAGDKVASAANSLSTQKRN
jgi:membrane fusion protein, copper/silver efflux system